MSIVVLVGVVAVDASVWSADDGDIIIDDTSLADARSEPDVFCTGPRACGRWVDTSALVDALVGTVAPPLGAWPRCDLFERVDWSLSERWRPDRSCWRTYAEGAMADGFAKGCVGREERARWPASASGEARLMSRKVSLGSDGGGGVGFGVAAGRGCLGKPEVGNGERR